MLTIQRPTKQIKAQSFGANNADAALRWLVIIAFIKHINSSPVTHPAPGDADNFSGGRSYRAHLG
jgi:hypothetical protein